jgi:hypothetical protein
MRTPWHFYWDNSPITGTVNSSTSSRSKIASDGNRSSTED